MFKLDQKVIFVDSPGFGFIRQIVKNDEFMVEDEHGFIRMFRAGQIAPIRISREKLDAVDKVPQEKANPSKPKVLEKHNALPEVIDLHIHEIVDRHEHWSNTEIVNYQMEYLKAQLKRLMEKRVKTVHIIHGVGEGVLRAEVRQYLRKFKNCEINDMSYTRKGFGATEFIIRYKGNV